jgi:hydrogenase maturation factor
MTECVAAHGCITCGDVATPMRVVKIDSDRSLALCSNPEGERSSVEIALVEPVAPGDLLLVHAGTALGHAEVQDSDPDHTRASAPNHDAPERNAEARASA